MTEKRKKDYWANLHIVSLIPNPEFPIKYYKFLKQSTYLDVWCYFCQNNTQIVKKYRKFRNSVLGICDICNEQFIAFNSYKKMKNVRKLLKSAAYLMICDEKKRQSWLPILILLQVFLDEKFPKRLE